MMVHFTALLCVLGISAGQILFKLSANRMRVANSFLDPAGLGWLLVALVIYGVATLAWIWVLQKADLGRIYPLMALAFVLVPLGSRFILGESFQPNYFLGIILIGTGILVTTRG